MARTTTTSTPSTSQPAPHIPRPPNSWMIFRAVKNKQLTDPNAKEQQTDVSKKISLLWKALTPEEKAFWEDLAKLAALEHKRMYPTYKFQPKRKGGKGKKGKGKGKQTVGSDSEADEHVHNEQEIQFEHYSSGDSGLVASSPDSTMTEAEHSDSEDSDAAAQNVTFQIGTPEEMEGYNESMTVEQQSLFVESNYDVDSPMQAGAAYEIGWYSPDPFAAERQAELDADIMFNEYITYPEDEL